MSSGNPLLSQVFKILTKQGWVPVSEANPNMLMKPNGKLSDGFLLVREDAVETLGVIPAIKTPHLKFIADNARHLF